VAGNQLNQFPESYNLLGRKLIEVLHAWGYQPMPGSFVASLAAALSTQTLILFVLASSSRSSSGSRRSATW